jgi:hypothetical protein
MKIFVLILIFTGKLIYNKITFLNQNAEQLGKVESDVENNL